MCTTFLYDVTEALSGSRPEGGARLWVENTTFANWEGKKQDGWGI